MANFFTDNPDIAYHFRNLDLREVVAHVEDGYAQSRDYPYAPVNYDDAMENFRKVLEVVGELAANQIAPRAASVDEAGASIENGRVEYAPGTRENLRELPVHRLHDGHRNHLPCRCLAHEHLRPAGHRGDDP
jgi:hypothetical protein